MQCSFGLQSQRYPNPLHEDWFFCSTASVFSTNHGTEQKPIKCLLNICSNLNITKLKLCWEVLDELWD